MIVLVPIDDDGEDGAPLQFSQPHIRVGHGSHNDLILDDEDHATSYEHAMISVLDSRAVVFCDPTAKPTYIDGADVSSAPEAERQLKPGDIISFGKGRSIFRVRRIGEAVEAQAPSPRQVRARSHAGHRGSGRRDHPPQGQDRGVYPITFQVFKGDQRVREETFNQPLIRIGRMRSSHLLLDDKSVSRTHAVIEVTGEEEVLLLDLDSSSGTAVNGVRVKKAILKPGDQLAFGDARVIVGYGKGASSAAVTTPAQAEPERRERRHASSPPPIPHHARSGPADEREASFSPRIVVRRSGVEQGEIVLSKPKTTIGRLPQSDIQLDDGAVSGTHALLVAEAGVFLIIDQKSTNGTYLNGEKCAGDSLQDGDVIQIGRYELVFVASPPAPAQNPPKTEVLSPEAARAMFAKVGGRRGHRSGSSGNSSR
jgi:pSer/pThr/pTyr-binding forkhead associated (FHA) protein